MASADELHQRRQVWATQLAALNEEQEERSSALLELYREELRKRGVAEEEIEGEVMEMIRQASPLSRDYDLAGLEEDDERG